MTNQGTATAFAEGREKGKSLHMFIDGDTVYSYGKHFPIARHTSMTYQGKNVVLFTRRGYSSTTARHMSYVRYALSSAGRYAVLRIENDNSSYSSGSKLELNEATTGGTSAEHFRELKEYQGKAKRARTNRSREYWEGLENETLKQMAMLKALTINHE